MTLDALADALGDLAWHLENQAGLSKGKSAATLREAAQDVRDLIPDTVAMQPEPDPVAAAQSFLLEERERAQELLRAEANRMRAEAFIKEAYFMPAGILSGILDRAIPDDEESRPKWERAHARAKEFLEGLGWTVDSGFGQANPAYIRSREPLRKLARLIDDFPRSHLTSNALAVIHYALLWCENTSFSCTSPITGRCQHGTPPDGVLYPRISMEFVKVENSRNIPKEWTMPLVDEGGAA
jgi:hypothetical protein